MTLMSFPVLPTQPLFTPVRIPLLGSIHLSQEERDVVAWLQMRAWRNRASMLMTDSYYRGEQILTSMGVSIPKELAGLRTIVGWPAIAIDPIDERLSVEGFRMANATDSDQTLYDIWQDNDLDAEQSLAHIDAMSMGRAYLTVGSNPEPGESPIISAESPLNISVRWDVRSRKPIAALQTYWLDERRQGALYLPDQTIHLGEDDDYQWQVIDRDQHNFGMVPVVRMANRPRSNMRDGASEITPAIMSVTDAACRTLLQLDVAGEIYSVPQRYALGVTESDFQDANGQIKTAWQTYITRMLALERDEDGNLPTLGQFPAYDPATFTKVIDMYASKMAGMLGAPPQDLGLYSEGNPASADAIRSSEARRDRKAKRKQALFGCAWVQAMQMAMRFLNGGDLPEAAKRMEADWADPATPTPAATTDALQKQVAAGMVSPTSDVVLKRAGYSAVERARLAEDRKLDQGASILAELAHSLQAKEARTDLAVARDINPAAVNPTAAPANDNPTSRNGPQQR